MTAQGLRAAPPAPSRGRVWRLAGTLGFLILIVLVFAAIRVLTDWPHILDGTTPDDDFAVRYVEHPWLSYLHIVPGILYLVLAPLQLAQRFRTRHYDVHRRLGRVLVACALVSGTFALLFGVPLAWGGRWESLATVVFGTWFLTCVVLAFRAIRRDAVPVHRRWMIRAFGVAVGIGTIRIWIGLFQVLGVDFHDSFAIAFWVAFTMHVLAAEWWLRRTPDLTG